MESYKVDLFFNFNPNSTQNYIQLPSQTTCPTNDCLKTYLYCVSDEDICDNFAYHTYTHVHTYIRGQNDLFWIPIFCSDVCIFDLFLGSVDIRKIFVAVKHLYNSKGKQNNNHTFTFTVVNVR